MEKESEMKGESYRQALGRSAEALRSELEALDLDGDQSRVVDQRAHDLAELGTMVALRALELADASGLDARGITRAPTAIEAVATALGLLYWGRVPPSAPIIEATKTWNAVCGVGLGAGMGVMLAKTKTEDRT